MYRIRNWKQHFENNRTRELKNMVWVPFPNKQDGDGYTELMDHADGVAHFGTWVALVQVASRCDPRGTLLRDSGAPHCGASLSRMTRIPEAILASAIPRLISIGWLEEIATKQGVRPASQEGATIPQEGALEEKRREEKTEEHTLSPAATESGRSVKASISQCEAIYRHYPRKVGRESALKAIGQAVKRLAESRDDPHAYLLERTHAYATAPAGQPPPAGANDYRPHPSTWFNQGRYDDDIANWQRPNGVNGSDQSTAPGRIDAPAGKYAHLSDRSQTLQHPTHDGPAAGEPAGGGRF